MRVTCSLCKFESEGTCTKKSRSGKAPRVKLTKRRTCGVYVEDPMKVFTDFRKREAHRTKLREQGIKRARIEAIIKNLKDNARPTGLEGTDDKK